jgi:hypothetical protein
LTYQLDLQQASYVDEDQYEKVNDLLEIEVDALHELHHRLKVIDATMDD